MPFFGDFFQYDVMLREIRDFILYFFMVIFVYNYRKEACRMSAYFGSVFYNLGFFGRLLIAAGRYIFQKQTDYKILVKQILYTFVEALGIASLLALGIGAAVNIVGIPFLTSLSQERLIYSLLIAIITRELGPLLTAFIIIARSATAIATAR